MTDPFDIEAHPPFVMNISTGMHATREVQDSLLSAGNEGEKSAETLLTALQIFYDGFFSAHIAPNTIEAAGCLSNGKLAFFKS
jgi:hypothetical protein